MTARGKILSHCDCFIYCVTDSVIGQLRVYLPSAGYSIVAELMSIPPVLFVYSARAAPTGIQKELSGLMFSITANFDKSYCVLCQ